MDIDTLIFILIIIVMFPLKFWIDKKRFLKQKQHDYNSSISPSDAYTICKSRIREAEFELNKYAKRKKLRVIWDPSLKPPNASATFPFLIVFTGDWSFLADSSLSSKAYLYSTLGHELAHKDNEPSYSFRKSTHNLKNHVREIRADFCGLSFAMNYFEDRSFVIQSKYIYKTNADNDRKTDHPSHKLRKMCLESHKQFSRAVIEDIVRAEEYCDISDQTKSSDYIDWLEKECYKGFIFRKGTF